ncbi:MAG: hypothetical protein BMS9Abin06_0148 [Gammaproteobacteria bacterium]|nr:MAG: hypothetical protein BMS9Abin06_0148 [Gammaproteobacteria bacterium]
MDSGLRRNDALIRASLGINIRNKTTLDQADGVLETQFTFFQSLELQLVWVVGMDQMMNYIIQVPVFQRQFFQLFAE